MSPIAFLKQYYQFPFRNEIQGAANLCLYKFVTKLMGVSYKVRHIIKVRKSWAKVKKIKAIIKNARKSVFVFANGPSLNDIDLSKIKALMASGAYDLIAINSFLSKSAAEILPTFAVFADNLHFEKKLRNDQYQNDINVCLENSVECFVPFQHFENQNDNHIGYNSFCEIYSSNTSDMFSSPGFYGLTALHALRIAKHLGYVNIYMCGFDNSYFKDFDVKESGEMIIRHRHYYDDASADIEVPCLYKSTSEFFFDAYRHFKYIEKITENSKNIINVSLKTFISSVGRETKLDIYKKP